MIGLGCVCVRLASFNQVSPTANTGRQVMRFRQQGLSGGTKGGRSRGAQGPALPFGECLSVFQWSLKGLCPSSCKIGRREASKIPNCCRSTPNCGVYSRGANQACKTENGMFFFLFLNLKNKFNMVCASHCYHGLLASEIIVFESIIFNGYTHIIYISANPI